MNRTKCTFLLVIVLAFSSIYASESNVIKASLNGLEFTFDGQTGSILSLSYPGPGKMLEAKLTDASIIDLAYPIEKFEAFRLASRFSKNAKITADKNQITVQWDKLGTSRQVFEQAAGVSVTVTLKAAPDGESVLMTAQIENNSDVAVKQVLFPDFMGILPFAGKDKTIFRTAGITKTPFTELAPKDECSFYAIDSTFIEIKSGGLFDPMILRWMDLGSLNGGISLFPKLWGWDEHNSVMMRLSSVTNKLRLMCAHNVDIKKGQKWQSPEYVLTTHMSGWAKGMEPYRQWVRQNFKRRHPLPKHVKEGLGYRTIWMSRTQPDDPQDAVWKISDLSKVARDCKEHGLDELSVWHFRDRFVLPLAKPYPNLGTEEEMVKAVAQCKEMGVNVAPLISVLQAGKNTAHKYGLTVPDSGGWTYHPELIPPFQAPYASRYRCAPVNTNNELWKKEVLDSVRHLNDIGIPSLGWDQYWTKPDQNMVELSKKMLDMIKKNDLEATFYGEELWNWEIDSEFLDYTWDWPLHISYAVLGSAFPVPRVNMNIEHSSTEVKTAFADNVYMNICPSKPDSINGSAYITDYPEFSKALKQCAKLRKQFLPYFTDGTLVGNCILSEDCPNTHISSYVLPDKVLMIIINSVGERKIDFKCDLAPWLKSESGKYIVKIYDNEGKITETKEIDGPKWQGSTANLSNLDIALFEVSPINK